MRALRPLVLVIALSSASAYANSVWDFIGDAIGYLTLAKPIAGAISRSVAEGLQPLLEQADLILKGRIAQAADEVKEILKQVIERVDRLIAERSKELITSVEQLVATSLSRIQQLLDGLLCKVLGPGDGIPIDLPPLLGSAAEVNVRRPKQTHCYRDYLGAVSDPAEFKFTGLQFYEGELCEAELALQEIDPMDPNSIRQVREGYAELATKAYRLWCKIEEAKDSAKKLIAHRKFIRYSAETAFFAERLGEK